MFNTPWTRRLDSLARLTPTEMQVLNDLVQAPQHYGDHVQLFAPGDPVEGIHVVLDGLACEFKLLPDGRRQILAFLFPGDMTDPRQLLLERWNHSACVLWPTSVATLSAKTVENLQRHPNITLAIRRYFMALRRQKLISFQNRHLRVLNQAGLERAAGFDCDYLQTVPA